MEGRGDGALPLTNSALCSTSRKDDCRQKVPLPTFAKPRYRPRGVGQSCTHRQGMYMRAAYNYTGTFDMHDPTANVTSMIAVISVDDNEWCPSMPNNLHGLHGGGLDKQTESGEWSAHGVDHQRKWKPKPGGNADAYISVRDDGNGVGGGGGEHGRGARDGREVRVGRLQRLLAELDALLDLLCGERAPAPLGHRALCLALRSGRACLVRIERKSERKLPLPQSALGAIAMERGKRGAVLTSFRVELGLLVLEGGGLEIELVLEAAPVVGAPATLGDVLVHAVLGLGAVLVDRVGVGCAGRAGHGCMHKLWKGCRRCALRAGSGWRTVGGKGGTSWSWW